MAKNKKSSKKVFIIVLLCFLLVGWGIFGYWYFFKLSNHDTPDVLVEEKEPEKPKVKIVSLDSTTRPYGVMINNISVARPYHSGLQDAYLVYEMIVEGGITRLYALFQDTNTDRIGPVRSARPYYLDYALENDAYFVHWGFSEQAKKDISSLKIQNINGLYQSKYFWKDQSLPVATEHTAFTSMEKLKAAVSDLGYRSTRNGDYLFGYSVDEILLDQMDSAMVANQVSIPYSKGTITSYVYNPELKVYERFVNGVTHSDYVTKKQYTVKNIIVYQVKNYSVDSYGRQALNNVSSGTGYYITNGYAVPIKWSKKSRDAKTVYTYLDGTELILNDGNTWIQIEPSSQNMEIS